MMAFKVLEVLILANYKPSVAAQLYTDSATKPFLKIGLAMPHHWGADTCIDFPDKGNFKKPGTHRPLAACPWLNKVSAPEMIPHNR